MGGYAFGGGRLQPHSPADAAKCSAPPCQKRAAAAFRAGRSAQSAVPGVRAPRHRLARTIACSL